MSFDSKQINSDFNNTHIKSSRNSLIELYRFLFALWVIYYHGFFIFKNQYFNHGYIAVEFFFILSGFYLIKAIDKYRDIPLTTALFKFTARRIRSLGAPFYISLIFVVWYMILDGEISFFGYMWYIPFMLLSFIIIFIFRRRIKSDSAFLTVLGVFVIVCYLVLYIPLLEGFGFCRGLGGVSLGVLISYIKKINLKLRGFNFGYLIVSILLGVIIYLAYLPKENLISEYFLVLLLIPMLIYFTSMLEINSSILNFLGSLSFGLYAYQCIIRVLEFYWQSATYIFFIILVAISVISKTSELLISSKTTKKQA